MLTRLGNFKKSVSRKYMLIHSNSLYVETINLSGKDQIQILHINITFEVKNINIKLFNISKLLVMECILCCMLYGIQFSRQGRLP